MASMDKFKKSGSAKAFEQAKKTESEKARVIVLQNISNENLFDNPKNGEDISMTSDLELSMTENGFTDPIEITDFGMEDGKYMILSGHRRRAAAVKVFGASFVFPCVVRHFDAEQEVQNYTLMANSQRDSEKDPLLLCGRYKLHEDYLKSVGFKGSKREEIARRLGISPQQADRYKAMNKIILPVWDMVRGGVTGMSSVQKMASHPEEEQGDIYNIMQEAVAKDVELTRAVVEFIVDSYRAGKKTWAEMANVMPSRLNALPSYAFMNTEPGETKEPGTGNRNDEVRREFDPIAAEQDRMDADRAEWERQQAEAAEHEDDFDSEGEEPAGDTGSENSGAEEKHRPTEEEQQEKLGEEISKLLHKLETSLGRVWKCGDEEAARQMVINMKSMTQVMVEEAYRLADEYSMEDEFKSFADAVTELVQQYK